MKNYLKNQKVIERKPRSKLVKTLVLLGAVSLLPASAIVIDKYFSSVSQSNKKSNYELLIQAREIYNKEILDNADYQTLRGTESVIKNLEAGKGF